MGMLRINRARIAPGSQAKASRQRDCPRSIPCVCGEYLVPLDFPQALLCRRTFASFLCFCIKPVRPSCLQIAVTLLGLEAL